ncbi:unnamed protein product [Pleuronectes platessa]|uniref:MADF domain-containing protein n=1 Tax=Pleuronectes platessa TaxID=8262 RepID=A0A9N7Y5G5_PLEPL|nr:unnamed protein product [Pleuronectes platessa]
MACKGEKCALGWRLQLCCLEHCPTAVWFRRESPSSPASHQWCISHEVSVSEDRLSLLDEEWNPPADHQRRRSSLQCRRLLNDLGRRMLLRHASTKEPLCAEEIRTYDHLYNPSLTEYKDAQMACNSWKEISANVGLQVDECTKLWRKIRDNLSSRKRLEEPQGRCK